MADLKPKITQSGGLSSKIQSYITAFALVISSGAVLISAQPASAASLKEAFVGHVTTVGTNTSCTDPGYKSVQAAVDAVSVTGEVYLCGAPFAEQVFVKKNLTLTGDPGSGLTAVGTSFATADARYPSKFATDKLFLPKALLVVSGTPVVNVSGLSFDGPMLTANTCAQEDYGILQLGGKLNLSNSTVENIADSSSAMGGCQFGVGIEVGRKYWPKAAGFSPMAVNFAASANISGVTVSGYQKNGITVDGVGSSANVSQSTVTGDGSTTVIAQNGIQISRGATGNVYDNTVSDNAYSGAGFATAAGILVYGGCGDDISKGVSVYKNTLADNDVAVNLANYNAGCNGPSTAKTNDYAFSDTVSSAAVTNVTGLCDGSVSCGGSKIGYQAGVEDVGNGDDIYDIASSGAGYTAEGTYNYSVNPPVFTKTGPDNAFVRVVDAGDSFPTTDATVYAIH